MTRRPQVYFIAEGAASSITAIKIGRIGAGEIISARLSTLQTGNPRDLKLLAHFDGIPAEERYLHTFFAASRIRGEWFEPVERLQMFIESCKTAKKLDLVALASCTWAEDANGNRTRKLFTCNTCDRCHRVLPTGHAELLALIEKKIDGSLK